MKNTIFFLLVVLCAASVLSMQRPSTHHDKGFGNCGIWVELTIDIDTAGDRADVLVFGGPGHHKPGIPCLWKGLEVSIQAHDPIARKWISAPGYSGPQNSWSRSYSINGFNHFRVLVKGYDTFSDGHRGRAVASIEAMIARGS